MKIKSKSKRKPLYFKKGFVWHFYLMGSTPIQLSFMLRYERGMFTLEFILLKRGFCFEIGIDDVIDWDKTDLFDTKNDKGE